MRIPLYVASPLGFSGAGRHFYYGKLLSAIGGAGEWDILDPWVLTDSRVIDSANSAKEGIERRHAWAVANHYIGANNERGIMRSKIMVAVLDGSDVDSGTASEIGFASGLKIPIIGYRSDFRLSGDTERWCAR